MKAYLPLFALILMGSPLQAQTARPSQETEQSDEKKKEQEGLDDQENKKNRWEASLPGGEYSVNLNHIASVSKHSYVLDGTLLVTEVTVDTMGTALARFYFMEPITKDTEFNALARVQKRAQELRERTRDRVGTQIDEMAQKTYPVTTHAKTIEFRIMSEGILNSLYSSLYTAWDTGKGRTFRIK